MEFRMRSRISLIALLLAVAVLPAGAQSQAKVPYVVEFAPDKDVWQEEAGTGKQGLHFTVRFKIKRLPGAGDEPGKDYKVVVEEDGREVARFDVPPPRISEELSAVLAVDISGSMDKEVVGLQLLRKRIDQARLAARTFVDRLPLKADCGLI